MALDQRPRRADVRRGTRFTGYIGSCMDVTEKVEGRKLIDLAHYDTLTSVFNRNYLEILIDFESQKSQKENIRSA